MKKAFVYCKQKMPSKIRKKPNYIYGFATSPPMPRSNVKEFHTDRGIFIFHKRKILTDTLKAVNSRPKVPKHHSKPMLLYVR